MNVGTKEIAEMLQMNRRYVTDRLVKRCDFPAPVVNVSPRQRRWEKRAVEVWAASRH